VNDLQEKVAVVTGAASGIGLALATRFAEEGMRLVLADIDEAALAAALDRLTATGAQAIAVPTDVAQPAQVDALAGTTLTTYGAVHVVCNNAGVWGPTGRIWEISPADWQWILDVNLVGAINGMRSFVPHLLKQDEGHVVNTASVAGLVTGALGPYAVTKHALVALSEALHHQLRWSDSKVGVSVLCPHFTRTNIVASRRVTAAGEGPEDAVQGFFEQAVATGMDPAEIPGPVVAAIREGRFYVLPAPELTLPAVERRMQDIAEGAVSPVPFAG
jgi:NAD(P)-dependent dehydrogenase (short-subunit alcohol dehydrogenase family)